MVAHRADDEHRHFDVGDRHRPSADLVASLGQIVVQIQTPQVLAVHAIRHACHVGIPGHQVIELLPFAQQVLAHAARPDQVARVEHLERGGHLLAVEIALVPHPGFQPGELTVVDEKRDFARLAEVGLRRQQRQTVQPFVAIARHRGCGDRQQGAAQAIANRLHLALGHDGRDRVQCIHDPQPSVILEAEVAIGRGRVLPGKDEHRMPLVDQVLHHRVVR